MAKSYLRPTGLCYGADARAAVGKGRGGRLGGSSFISFLAAEVITREAGGTRRELVAYGDLPKSDTLARIEMRRQAMAGISLERPAVMGIVNVTPDSFSDGGRNAAAETAIANGLAMAEEGAAILDVGGESTRPGSEGVGAEEELRRIEPVIAALADAGKTVSCDTRKASVMRRAAAAGAAIVNDVSALQHDPASLPAVADLGVPVMLMHAQGDPRTMQLQPVYDEVVLDVFDMLEARVAACRAAGIAAERIAVDPGIGFGKTFQHNLEVLAGLTIYHGLGCPLLAGLSRKAFIGALTGEKVAGNRVNGSVGGAVHAALNGAHMLRVHDVKATVEALAVAMAAADPASSGF